MERNLFPEISISKLIAKLNRRLISEKNKLRISKLLAFLQQKKLFFKVSFKCSLEVRRLGSHCVLRANSAGKSGLSKFWMKSCNVKEYENSGKPRRLGRHSFFGSLRNWGPAYLTFELIICWGVTLLGIHVRWGPQ